MYFPFEIRRIIYFFLGVFPVHHQSRLIPLENLLEYTERKTQWVKAHKKEERFLKFSLPVWNVYYYTNLYVLHLSEHIFSHLKYVSREDWINREDGTWQKI